MAASIKRKTVAALFALLAALYAYRQREALTGIAVVFAFAGAFMVMLSPLCGRLEKKGVPAQIAAALAICAFVLVLLLIVAAFVPYLAKHTLSLVRRNAPTLLSLAQQAGDVFSQLGFQGMSGPGDAMAAAISKVTSLVARSSVAFAAQTGRIFFALVLAYYLLAQRRRVGGHLLLIVPLRYRTLTLSMLRASGNAALSYLSGMLKTSAFVGASTYLGLLLLGIPDALLLALFMGLFEILPYIGPVLAAVPILLSSLPLGMDQALLSLLLVVIVQQVEGNFISPYFTASSTSVSPLTALVSVFVLGSLLGVWGILLAVPLVAAGRSVLWSIRQARAV